MIGLAYGGVAGQKLLRTDKENCDPKLEQKS